MKKALFLLLALVQILVLASCGGTPAVTQTSPVTAGTETAAATEPATLGRNPVPSPTVHPDYAAMVGSDTSIEHLREIAVKAMRDELTIQWFPAKDYTYNKTGAVSGKNFQLFRNRTYQGLPYTSAGMGIYQFLEYCDPETGEMSFTDPAMAATSIGNSCASSPAWALFTVCTSIRGGIISNFLTIANGFYPLGGVTYDPTATNLKPDLLTPTIIKANGEDKVVKGYTELQPADLVVTELGGDANEHTMMAVEKPVVVTGADGKIDLKESYVIVQDQRAGDYQIKESGMTMWRSGRCEYKCTFEELLTSSYIAVTVAEFMGTKEYEKTVFTLSNEFTTIEELQKTTLSCNRAIAVVKLTLTKADGTTSLINRHMMTRGDVGTGMAFDCDLSKYLGNLGNDRRLPKSGTFTLTLTAIAADGITVTYPLTVTR